MDILKLSNADLLQSAKKLASEERKIQVEFLWHLLEIQKRRLYLDIGYGSLFDYVTKDLGFSESSAYRRIQAMRLLRSVPNIADKIEEGSLNLTSAAQVQSFIKAEDKSGVKVSYRQKIELFSAVENKSTREVEKHLIGLKPENVIRPEKIRFVTPEIIELKIMIPDSLKIKMDDLRFYFSHVNPDMSYLNLIEYLTEKALSRIAAKNNIIKNETKNEMILDSEPKHIARGPRHIPSTLRHAVWLRDGGVCSFLDPGTNRKCGARYHVQVDHIKPWNQGGEHSLDNLQLLCGEHNRKKGSKFVQKT